MRPLAVALLLAVPALAADKEKPATLDEQIKNAKLSEAEAKALKEHGFVVGGAEYKQVFKAYFGRDVPVFVTADSLLNAFHVLFEESVFRMERANARKLPLILADIEKQLPAAEKALAGDADLTKKASARARVFLGVARLLLDPKVGQDEEKARAYQNALQAVLDTKAGRAPLDSKAESDDEVVRRLVKAEVERVTAAKGTEKPDWLGKPDKGFVALDYSRFKPRGFYTRSPELERYFRAVSWLQAIPWRFDNDDELAAFLLLVKAYREVFKPGWVGEHFWGTSRVFLGCAYDWDVHSARLLVPKALNAEGLTKSREWAKGFRIDEEVNDQLRFQPDTPDGKPEVHFRFVSAYRLPDAVLLQRTATDKRMPSGLDVAAALGSPFARGKLKKESQKALDEMDKSKALFAGSDYLDCLRVLLEQPEPDAPKVFKSDAWAAKTCQTALSGWAQMRHTWVLQAKQSAHYLGTYDTRAGFVEPVPEFYGRFGELLDRTEELFEKAGAFDPAVNPRLSLKEIQGVLDAIVTAEEKGLVALSDEERKAIKILIPDLPATGDPSKDKDLKRILYEAHGEIFDWLMAGGDPTPALKDCWAELKTLCTKVERIAHRQLRGLELSEEEQRILRLYGKTLGYVMFYTGNAFLSPKDDAPRIVDVHTDPQKGKVLEVGIGQPRVLWVVYPWKGADVLCRGAVLPYHEFASPDRLTDKEWLKLLDAPKAPEQPEWVNGWTVPREKKEK